jgi:hypothetical protein
MRTIEIYQKTSKRILGWDSATVDVSYDMLQDIKEEAIRRFNYNSEDYTERGAISCLEITLYNVAEFLKRGGVFPKNNIRMLNAHGAEYSDGSWIYCDFKPGDKHSYWVQEWINEYQGHYEVLFINSCNPGKHILSPAKSTIIYPRDKFDSNAMARELFREKNETFLIVPPLLI